MTMLELLGSNFFFIDLLRVMVLFFLWGQKFSKLLSLLLRSKLFVCFKITLFNLFWVWTRLEVLLWLLSLVLRVNRPLCGTFLSAFVLVGVFEGVSSSWIASSSFPKILGPSCGSISLVFSRFDYFNGILLDFSI